MPWVPCFNPRGPCGPRQKETGIAYSTRSFNPRGPCGPRQEDRGQHASNGWFQSTRPVWAATHLDSFPDVQIKVSIHAARVGRDPSNGFSLDTLRMFQSTRPVWAATETYAQKSHKGLVSIHAARVGRDLRLRFWVAVPVGFNPRGPCGPRRPSGTTARPPAQFQSTRPVWAATIGMTSKRTRL